MKLALCQMQMSESAEMNLEKSLAFIEEAAQNGADMIVFPEIQLSPFFPQYPGLDVRDRSVAPNSETVARFCEACRRHHMIAVPNLYLKIEGKYFDTSLVISEEGQVIGDQKMVHIAQADRFFEQDYYAPAEDGFKVFDTPFGKVGIVVCFDRHYPESIRTEALRGADLILVPTANTKAEPSDMFEWEIRVQAFQNCVAIAMCNRVGLEGDMDFSGESLVTDATGNLLLKASDQEGLFYADVDMAMSAKIRNVKPYTSLRRTELYE
ncbi:MAG: carbon-nitrogen hydrolase family protein [Bacteroidales bacterium]|nr:carbon-nitrogen hydrolase family protein [Bacteroidales bacterium]